MIKLLAIITILSATTAAAQKPPKIDSLVVELPVAKVEAVDAVLAAFAQVRLDVTDQTSSLVTADLGSTDSGLSGTRFDRVVRALVIPRSPDSSAILITGEERRTNTKDNRTFKRLRIDNRAGGNGEKAWCRMVAAALALDSTQVSEDARKTEKCAERLR